MDGSDAVTKIAASVTIITILVGVFILAWHGTITGGEALGVIGGISSAAVGAFAVHSGVSVGARAALAAPTPVADPAPAPAPVAPTEVTE